MDDERYLSKISILCDYMWNPFKKYKREYLRETAIMGKWAASLVMEELIKKIENNRRKHISGNDLYDDSDRNVFTIIDEKLYELKLCAINSPNAIIRTRFNKAAYALELLKQKL